MTPEEFRRHGYAVVDWISEYLAHPEQHRVFPASPPGALIDALPGSAPERGEPMERILEDFRRLIVPAATHWNHPGFMGFFAISSTPPGILAEALIAALNINGMLWRSGPAATELEQVTLDWLRQWLGLPAGLFGIILDTASTSTMHAIAAAREAADPEARTKGGSRSLVLYTSEQAHSSVEKGAIAIGVGHDNVRKIPLDAAFRMRPDVLEAAIRADLAAGRKPFCVVPTVGTTSTTAIDPVPEIVSIAKKYDLWVHVDAAYGGTAAVLPEFRWVLNGAAQADSLVVNPHKWLGTPIDLSVLYTARPQILRRAFSLTPDYLTTHDDSRALNYMDYSLALGRRFRSLKLWFVMRSYGREGIAEKIRSHIAAAHELAAQIEAHPRFQLSAPCPLSLVCFRYDGTNEQNQALLDQINAGGEAFLSHTMLHGQLVLRLAVGNFATMREHVQRAWQIVKEKAASLE